MITKKDNPFWVSFDEIPSSGQNTDIDLEPEWTAPILGEAYRTVGKNPRLRLSLTKDLETLIVEGALLLDLEFDCSRCAETVAKSILFPVKCVFVPADKNKVRLNELETSAGDLEGLFEYAAKSFSVEQPFIEAVVLGLDPFPLCSPSCRGLCPACGAPLVDETCPCGSPAADPKWAALADIATKIADRKDR
jgi:uncharacterized protein